MNIAPTRFLVAGIFLLSFAFSIPVEATTFPGNNGIVAATRNAPSRIWSIDPDNGTTMPISGAGATQPLWSPRGKWMAYVRGGYVFVATPSGNDIYHVPHDIGVADSTPVWSSDGSKLAFVRTNLTTKQSAVYSARIGDRVPTNVSGWTGKKNYRAPSWSPDARQLVYEEYSATAAHLLIKDSEIGTVRELTPLSDVTDSSRVLWSPTGKKILFRDSATELYTIWPDGTHRAVISDGDSYNGVWSPDGTRIAFIEDPSDETISISGPDGTVAWIPIEKKEHERLGSLAWSPDGKKLIISIEKSGTYDLFVFDLTTGKQMLLLQNSGSEMSWQAR